MKKSKTNKKLDGVLGGIAEYYGADATLLRLAYALFGCFYPGLAFIMYIVASAIMSKDETPDNGKTENKE